ncbi:MAG: YceI family protein [Bacteroidia bacterium]|nr:YceI family protein [Bacteroidia bacterium]
MKSFIIALITVVIFIPFTHAQDVELPIDGSHSVVSFSVGFAGGISSIDGRFNDFNGVIGYKDKSDRSSLYCNVTIDATSLNTGNTGRDKDLNGAGWFNTEEFSTITFESKKTMKTEAGFAIIGDFTMMGMTEEITIPFAYQHEQDVVFVFGEPRIAALGTFQLDRTKYGIPKRGFGNIVPSLGTMALLKEVDIKLMIMGRGPSIGGLVTQKIKSDGSASAIAMYEEMENEHAGKDTYIFGEQTISGLVTNLVRGQMMDEALDMARYGLKRYPDSAMSHYMLGAVHDRSGNKEAAMKGYEKAIQLNPEFGRAKQALEKLKEGGK